MLMPFGRYRGWPVKLLPPAYLVWLKEHVELRGSLEHAIHDALKALEKTAAPVSANHLGKGTFAMTCQACSTKGCTDHPCPRLESQLPTTGNALSEKLMPTSELPHRPKLILAEMERGGSTGMAKLQGFNARDTRLLHARYIERLTHPELAERFGFTERSSWVICHRIKIRAVKALTYSEVKGGFNR